MSTPREADVLELAAGGAPVEEIASRVHLSPGTVRNHLSAAAAKLGAPCPVAPLGECKGPGAGVGPRRLDEEPVAFHPDRGGAHVEGAELEADGVPGQAGCSRTRKSSAIGMLTSSGRSRAMACTVRSEGIGTSWPSPRSACRRSGAGEGAGAGAGGTSHPPLLGVVLLCATAACGESGQMRSSSSEEGMVAR